MDPVMRDLQTPSRMEIQVAIRNRMLAMRSSQTRPAMLVGMSRSAASVGLAKRARRYIDAKGVDVVLCGGRGVEHGLVEDEHRDVVCL